MRISARNAIDYGATTTVNTVGALIETVPSEPAGPTRGSGTTGTSLEIDWVALTTSAETGGSAITSYNLEWDDHTNQVIWYEVEGETSAFLGLTTTHTTNVVQGNRYYFRLRGQNTHGWGDYSDIIDILAAVEPSVLAMITVTDNADTTVRIAWNTPVDNGSPVTAFYVEFLATNGTYYEDTVNCDGDDLTIIANEYCDVPMTVFAAEPYNLVQDDQIVATVMSYNEIGWSTASTPNTAGALVQTVPLQPLTAPTLNTQTGAAITVDMATVSGTYTGGSTITSYNLQYNGGDPSTTYVTVIGENPESLLQTYTKNGLTTDVWYSFKYRVANKFGWGPFSSSSTFLTAILPDQVPDPTFQVVGDTSVRIQWTAPTNGGNAFINYAIYIRESDLSTYSTETTYCDGSSATIISNQYCDIPFVILRASPFSLPLDALITV